MDTERRGVTQIDSAYVVERLEAAGRVLAALPNTGASLRIKVATNGFVAEMCDDAVTDPADIVVRLATPGASAVTAMDEAFSWLALVPTDRLHSRRIVASRCLINGRTDRHVWSWAKLGKVLGVDGKTVQSRHSRAVAAIVLGLRK